MSSIEMRVQNSRLWKHIQNMTDKQKFLQTLMGETK